MRTGKTVLGCVVGAAMLMASSAPALARPDWGYPGHHRPYYGHRGGDGFGNFLLGAVVAGGIIAVASAASKDKHAREAGTEAGGTVYSDHVGEHADRSRAWTDEENDAADACADAAERLASRRDINGKVDDISYVSRDGEGYRVEGVMEGGRALNCGIRHGDVNYIQFEDRVAAR